MTNKNQNQSYSRNYIIIKNFAISKEIFIHQIEKTVKECQQVIHQVKAVNSRDFLRI